MKHLIFVLLIFSTSVSANDNVGKVCFGNNLAKPSSEHTDRLYLKINDSEKLYFNRLHKGPVLENLDLNIDHIVKVYFDDQIVISWILSYSKLKTQSVIIWRYAGSWRMEPVEETKCK